MAPIKRSAALRPLSVGHHEVLLVVLEVRRGLLGRGAGELPPTLGALAGLVAACLDEQLRPHFAVEERLLLPASDPEAARLAEEHRRILALGAAVAGAAAVELPGALLAFASALEAHLRWEDRELFGRIETTLQPEALAALGVALAELAPVPACNLGRSAP